MKKIYIIILHYGQINLTKKCIMSLIKRESSYAKIVIVNNNSQSSSKSDFSPKNTIVINNNKNLGFAGGVNIGIKYAMEQNADYVCILNNDTLIKEPFLKSLVLLLDSNKSIGIIGPAISFLREGKTVFDIGGKINGYFGRTSHEEVSSISGLSLQEVSYVTGAAMIVRKEVFQKIGLFDLQFFLYYEDVDLCLRAKEKGFRIVVAPHVIISHSLSKTVGKNSTFAIYHQTRSAVLFGRKYMHGFLNQFFNIVFLIMQTSLITFKHPKSGIDGWKALLMTFFN
ncbi:MAG: glycosyltransferase family 2 protein [Candidatus Levyibacteriota bacterium]